MDLYIPPNSRNLKDQKDAQIKLGIQGASGTGKTWSAMTFPNPVLVNFDKGARVHFGKNVIELPFWDDDWIIKEMGCAKSKNINPFANKKEAFRKWMSDNARKLAPEQTLIIDSWTTLQDAFDLEQNTIQVLTQQGKLNEYYFWEQKQAYAQEICGHYNTMKCNLIVLFHETQTRDEKGKIIDKAAPVMQGGYVTKLKIPFDDYFRMVKEVKKDTQGREIGSEYFWQIKDDLQFDAKCRIVTDDKLLRVKATYEDFYVNVGGYSKV